MMPHYRQLHYRQDGVAPTGIPSCSCGGLWPCPGAPTRIPAHIEDGLRGLLGIPTNRIEALRQLVRELRSCRSLAVAADTERGLIDAAIRRVQADLDRADSTADRADSTALAAAVYTPEVQ